MQCQIPLCFGIKSTSIFLESPLKESHSERRLHKFSLRALDSLLLLQSAILYIPTLAVVMCKTIPSIIMIDPSGRPWSSPIVFEKSKVKETRDLIEQTLEQLRLGQLDDEERFDQFYNGLKYRTDRITMQQRLRLKSNPNSQPSSSSSRKTTTSATSTNRKSSSFDKVPVVPLRSKKNNNNNIKRDGAPKMPSRYTVRV